MMSYLEYKLITNAPLSANIYELQKNIGASSYSLVFNLAKKLARMGIIEITKRQSNGRSINEIRPGPAYAAFKTICDQFFRQYYSQATGILKKEIEEAAHLGNLDFRIIGGQLDPSRAYADIQIAIPEKQATRWKKAIKKIETNLNYQGITTEPGKQKRMFLRKLHVIPLQNHERIGELMEKIENRTLADIHYGSTYAELRPYFIHLESGIRNG